MKTIRQQRLRIHGILTTLVLMLVAATGFAQKKQVVNNSSESIRPFEYHATQK